MTTPEEPGQPQFGEPQPPQYGQPQPPAYGTPPPPPPGYGAPPPGSTAPGQYGAPPPGFGGPQLADWGSRVVGGLVDYFGPAIVADLVYFAINRAFGALLLLLTGVWGLYNGYLQGQTGQSYGKRVAGTRLVSESTGQTIGGGLGVARALAHIVDGIPCYLGFLWPLWDAKKQTFADKIVSTLVLKV